MKIVPPKFVENISDFWMKKIGLYGCCNVCWLDELSCSGLALLQ